LTESYKNNIFLDIIIDYTLFIKSAFETEQFSVLTDTA